MTPLADVIGPLAEGVLLLGIVPAALLVTVMLTVSRMVEWKTTKSLAASRHDPERQLPDA